jgi:rubrerythrin
MPACIFVLRPSGWAPLTTLFATVDEAAVYAERHVGPALYPQVVRVALPAVVKGVPLLFRNKYACPSCGTNWEDSWDSGCDDDCPTCGQRHIAPSESEPVALAD